jgi:hypothetical protein
MGIEFQDFLGTIREDGVARGGSVIASNDHTLGTMEGEDGRRFQW